MRTPIVHIGNLRGVSIPKLLIEQSGLEGEVKMNAENSFLLIRPITKPRAGWAKAFREMARHGDDALLDDQAATLPSWDEDEWEWS